MNVMLSSNGIRIILWTFLVIIKGASGTITLRPLNSVAELYGQAVFYTQATGFRGGWYFSENGAQSEELFIVMPPCDINTGFEAHYRTNTTGGTNACNLIVANITMAQAGVYRYQEQDSVSALLTVTDSSPVITVNSTNDTRTVVENQSVIIECLLNHNGSVTPAPTLRPYFFWTDFNGQNVSSSYDSTTANTAVSQLTVTAGRQNIMPYACHVYLQLTQTSTGYATNIPTVSKSANSSNIEVLYGPSKPSSTSRPEVITINGVPCGISVLTCSSTANPAPSYRWYDSAENVILSTTNTLDLAEVNRNYTCEAYNTIRNVLYSESTTYIVSKENCTSAVNCCVFPHDETTSVKVEGCDSGTMCDCSQGSSGIVLICNATSYPNASYMWNGPNVQSTDSPIYDKVTMNGTYRCTAYFNRSLSNYTGNIIFQNGTNDTTVDKCYYAANATISTIPIATATTAHNAATTTISITPIETATTAHASTPSTPSTNSDVAIAVAIAMGVLFGISLLVIIILLVILIRGKRVPDLFITTENIREPETLDPSDLSTPSAYEELRRPDEISLQPTTYEQLTLKPPLYVNQLF